MRRSRPSGNTPGPEGPGGGGGLPEPGFLCPLPIFTFKHSLGWNLFSPGTLAGSMATLNS